MGCIQQNWKISIHCLNTLMMISHQLENFVMNENGEKLYRKLMKQFFNLRWYIQHLVDEYEYQYGDNEWTNPLHESNWTYRTNKQFMKYVNFTLKEMTPEQMKIKPIKPIVKDNTNEELDTDKGESIEEEEEFTTSEKLTEDEYSTFSDTSKKILNQILMLMILNIKKIHIHLKHCKTTQQYMINII